MVVFADEWQKGRLRREKKRQPFGWRNVEALLHEHH